MSENQLVLRPQKGPQEAYCASLTDICIFGGAAGSGKSFILLLEPLRHISDPNFRGVIFRKTRPMITSPGGLWDEAKSLWRHFGAEFSETNLIATFPSGAWIKFSHMEKENDKYAWQGSQLTFVAFDEVAHFSETQVFYMLSRLRSKSKVKPYLRMTCNPEYTDHWLYKLVKPFLDLSTGIPDREKSAKTLYLVNAEGEIHLSEEIDTLRKMFPTFTPKTYTFIAGNCFDNQALLQNNPEYLSNLQALDRVQRERLLMGSWHASLQGAGYFQRGDCEIVSPLSVPKRLKTVRAWDLASTEPNELYPNPDYTAGVKMSLCDDGFFYVEHCIRDRKAPAKMQDIMLNVAKDDGKNTSIILPIDVGQAGKVAYQTWSKPFIISGFRVKKALTRKGKFERFMGFANAVENGMVRVVAGKWNDAWFAELEMFNEDHKTLKCDQVDATSDAYLQLVNSRTLPDKFKYNPEAFTKANRFLL